MLERMIRRIRHRGPDAEGFSVDPDTGVHLGHCRLSILDHEGGVQPMEMVDGGLSIVFNGEIYNFRELRSELESLGARFRSDHSDTEVILQGYRHWGDAVIDRLNGMWAFAIHDRRRRILFCSRDRFGKKPFYYWAERGRFAFASELTALKEHGEVSSAYDSLALRKYFAYGFIPAPLSLVQGVSKLPGGCNLIFDLVAGSAKIRRYWRYRPDPDSSWLRRSVDEAAEALHGLLQSSIRRRFVADVPVGAFLSGGIDSSVVSALAISQIGRDRLKTFSIGFDESSFDESDFAQQVATHIGADHRLHRIRIEDAREQLPALLARLDEPIADSSILPTYLLCGFARHEVTVAIGGDGADELFAGYDPFKALRYAQWYQACVPKKLHQGIQALISRMPVSHRYMSLDFRLKRMLRGLNYNASSWLPNWMAPLTSSDLSELFAEQVEADQIYSEAIEAWERFPELDAVDRATCHFVELYLQDDILAKVDRSSMLHSLEVRSPFLDIDLVDFARRLPSAMKLRGSNTKRVLRVLAERLLPSSIVRRRKQGFALPVGRWFADGSLGEATFPAPSRQEFWHRRLSEHRRGKVDHRLYLWSETVLSGGSLRYDPSNPN